MAILGFPSQKSNLIN